MSPRRTRSGKVLSPTSSAPLRAAPNTRVARASARPANVVKTTRARRVRTEQAGQNQVENVVGNIEGEIIVAEETNVVGEMVEETNIQVEQTIEQIEEIEVNTTPSEDTIEVNAAPTNIDDSDAIEIVSESVNDSVIDLTDDTATTTNSPLRLGGHWSATHSFVARLPPNPWASPRPTQPPVMVDLTDSPANIQEQDIMNDSTQKLDTTASPGGGGGISVQCPVCLESLKSIKKSGCSMVSTVCGHIFCSRCLPASLRASGRCPSCRRRVGPTEYHKIFI